jgi:hypothetical protein
LDFARQDSPNSQLVKAPMLISNSPDESRVGSALAIAVIRLILPTVIIVSWPPKNWKANEIATIVGCFTGLVGTLVGAFLGIQIDSAGKQKVENLTWRALSELPP